MSFTRPFLLDTVFFRTALPCSGGYHMETGGMPLHDAVGINCKKGATTAPFLLRATTGNYYIYFNYQYVIFPSYFLLSIIIS